MGAKLYVGNLSFKATEDDVRELFETIGAIASVHLITDPGTGRQKGFGFVEMASETDVRKAIEGLNGTLFMDRALTVNEARPQKPRDQGGFGARGGRGGQGGFGGGRPGRGGGSGRGDNGRR